MTIESKDIIVKMLKNDGKFLGDPQAYSIYQYKQAKTDRFLYAVFMERSHFDLDISPYVASYKLLWRKDSGLTYDGRKLIENYGEKEQ